MGNTNWNYVIAAVEEMNFTKAEKRLYISQQSLSNYIAKLEKQFGIEFFNRKNTLTLTAAGESLYRYAKFIKMAVGEYASAHNEHFMVDEHWIQLMTRVMCMAAVAFQNESREIHE